MKIVQTKSHINKKIPFIEKHEYDYHDVINEDNAIGARKKPMIDVVLRKRLNHITYSVDTHPKSQIIRGMAYQIFFAWISIIVEELFAGNKIYLKKIGTLSLQSLLSRSNYKGRSADRRRSRNKGFYTKIRVDYDFGVERFKYKYPYWSFGKYYKNRLNNLEDNNIKY